jgi:hypothetical protein
METANESGRTTGAPDSGEGSESDSPPIEKDEDEERCLLAGSGEAMGISGRGVPSVPSESEDIATIPSEFCETVERRCVTQRKTAT